MDIVKERTRIVFTNYTDLEKRKLEDLVATDQKVFIYEDPDNEMICFPTGMETTVKTVFSKIPIQDHSKEYWEYDHITPVQHEATPRNQLQEDFIKFVLEQANQKRKVAGILSPGTGKGVPLHTKIPTPDGYKLMGDLKVGDKVFGADGESTTVIGVYDQGIKDVYKITFNDGRYALCDDQHLWSVKTFNDGVYRPKRTIDLLQDYKIHDKTKASDGTDRDPFRYKYRIPVLSGPVQYEHQDVPIDPYTLGALIGNGSLTEPALAISSGNTYVPEKIARRYGFETRKRTSGHTYYFYDNIEDRKRIQTRHFFADLPEMIGKLSHEKEIPEMYLYNDTETRWELLRGLMDTDGSIVYAEGRYHVTYSSCSKKLLSQIQFILKSLGFNATLHIDKRVNKYKHGFHGELHFLMPNSWKKHLFTIPYKHEMAYAAYYMSDNNRHVDHLIIKDIKLVKREETRCIKVDAPDSLFLTEDFIVTHNTFMACYSAIKVGLRTLIIVPTSGIKQQWGETLTGMFNVSPDKVKLVSTPKDFINIKADFVVVSQASLSVLNKTYNLEKIMKANKFGIKVIDEVQMWFHNIIKVDGSSNICHNWYLTGTFGRSADEENRLYQTMFGDLAIFREQEKQPTIFNRKPGNIYGMKPHMHVKMIWTKSGLSSEEIRQVTSSVRYAERSGKWVRYGLSIPAYTQLVIPPDGTMTKFLNTILKVIKMANTEVTYGKMLILSPTIASVNVLYEYVKKMYPSAKIGTIHSKNSKATNDRIKAECDILISTVKSCGTGFDVKDLSKLIVTEQFKSWILADQVSGRLRRRDDGKDTYMWDIADAQIPQLRAWANARADVLRKKAKTFKVIDM